MGINNPQEECPDGDDCLHCHGSIGEVVLDYQNIGFCTVVCEALYLRRQLIARGEYNPTEGLRNV